jgi:hypothetical protein
MKGYKMSEKLQNLDYLHLCLIEAVAKRLSVRPSDVVDVPALEAIVYTIQDDQMAGLDVVGLMADVAVKQYQDVLRVEQEIEATRRARAIHYWEQKLGKIA